MASINFLGSYSGIDQTMVDQLMEAERLPLVSMNTKVQDYETEKNAWKDINTRMNTLSSKIDDLKDEDLYTDKKFTSSVSGIVSASVDNDAIEGTYEIEATKLGKSTSLVGAQVTLADGDTSKDLSLVGTLNIKIGEGAGDDKFGSFGIEVEATDSLKDIVEKINYSEDNDSLVNATIVDSRIVINSVEAGAKTITIDDIDSDTTLSTGILSDLGLDTGATTTLGNDSEFTVNGISVTRSSNEISDVVDGLTFTLKEEGTTTLTVSKDYSDLESKIEAVVEQYNSTLSFMQSKSKAGNPDVAGSAGDLAGDSTLQRLISNLRTSISDTISGITTEYKSASSIGLTTVDNEGTLSFDKTVFEEAMDNNSEAVRNFFDANKDTGVIGFADKVDTFLEYYIDDLDGIIQGKQSSLETMIDTVNDKMDAFELRMEAKEAYYIKIFASLDTYMAQAESTTSWLTSQMSSMNSNSNS